MQRNQGPKEPKTAQRRVGAQYAEELSILESKGFTNKQFNSHLLEAYGGDVRQVLANHREEMTAASAEPNPPSSAVRYDPPLPTSTSVYPLLTIIFTT